MIVSIHQPNYLPWIGFFHKMSKSDIFVLLDTVQYTKNSFQNRTKIKTAQAGQWLTVPILTKGHFQQATNEIQIDNKTNWQKKHINGLKTNYGGTKYFPTYFNMLKENINKRWSKLVELNIALIKLIAINLDMKTKIIKATSLNISSQGTDLLLKICKSLGADSYLSGPSGKKYLSEEKFTKEGIRVKYHAFPRIEYEQKFEKFVPGLSIIDFLFNCGSKAFSNFHNN